MSWVERSIDVQLDLTGCKNMSYKILMNIDFCVFLCVKPIFVLYFSETVDEKRKIYEEAWEQYPKGLVPRRLPLNFLSGVANQTPSPPPLSHHAIRCLLLQALY